MTFHVPTVDLTPYVGDGSPAERAATAAAFDEAARTVGFVQVVGHGVPPSTTDGLAAAMDAFFKRGVSPDVALAKEVRSGRGL